MGILGLLLCIFVGWAVLYFAFKIHWALGLGVIGLIIIYTIIDIIIKLN